MCRSRQQLRGSPEVLPTSRNRLKSEKLPREARVASRPSLSFRSGTSTWTQRNPDETVPQSPLPSLSATATSHPVNDVDQPIGGRHVRHCDGGSAHNCQLIEQRKTIKTNNKTKRVQRQALPLPLRSHLIGR